MQQYLEIGKIVNTHGVKGEMKIIPLTDDPKRFKKLKWVYLDKLTSMVILNIESVKFIKNFVILKFKEINDMNAAEALKDLYLKVDRENAVRLPKDTFFISDLIGCDVFEEDGNKVGTLKDVLKTGSNDVYVVEGENNREILIPALKSVVKSVSLENSRVMVVLPEGLIDDEI